MQKKQVEIIPVQPYHFGQALAYLRRSPSLVLEKVNDKGYQRIFTFSGQPVLVRMLFQNPPNHKKITVEVCGEKVDKKILNQSVETLKRIFSLTIDPEPFHKLLLKDPVLGKQMSDYIGLRPVLIGDPYESLMWAIIGQQVNVTFANKLKMKLLDLCNNSFQVEGQSFPVLPKPQQVVELGEKKLRENQFSRQKAKYLITVSEAVANRDINFATLAKMPYEEACQSLIQYKGIGRWTAECVLMRGLGFHDVIPAGDLGIQMIVGQFYKKGERASEKEVRQIAETWSPWRSWVAFVWWHQLQMAQFEQKHQTDWCATSNY
ncbi:DNA-3-methyladenine glycosylase family protein [Alteribacillus sp. HJP-4]|uniref:DNA-3-methyladenine glycosylase family protein n=1 Tax=Alteribacillus sp. HJP-4 TaxID=2775394 RepID=UPI0035CCE360